MIYSRKAQVLLTEEEYKILEELSAKTHKKVSALIREAVEKVYVEQRRALQIKESIDHLLSLPPLDVPDDYKEWEKKYLKLKNSYELK